MPKPIPNPFDPKENRPRISGPERIPNHLHRMCRHGRLLGACGVEECTYELYKRWAKNRQAVKEARAKEQPLDPSLPTHNPFKGP